MREIGVSNLVPAPDPLPSAFKSRIHSDCQARLLDIELDLGNGQITFDAVKWAISELERIDEQGRNSGSGLGADQDVAGEGALGVGSSSKQFNDSTDVRQTLDEIQDEFRRLRHANLDLESKIASHSVQSGCEFVERDKQEDNSRGLVSPVEVTKDGDFENWRDGLNAAVGRKRKSGKHQSTNDGDKKVKMGQLRFSRSLKDAVIAADGGDAGRRMSERINARLEQPDCVFLTNLISHCLLVSLDQILTTSAREALGSTFAVGLEGGSWSADDKLATGSKRNNGDSSSSDGMWLNRWFVRTLLPSQTKGTLFATLDWLVAYMTATRSAITKLVLHDLVTDVQNCETRGESTLAFYICRTGVLEYAALRDPEHTFGSLLSIFSPTTFPMLHNEEMDATQDGGSSGLWLGWTSGVWLGLMVLCPKMFGALCRWWIPMLSVPVLKGWSSHWKLESDCASLPGVWTILGVKTSEEPRTRGAWLCTALIRRLAELAPVALNVVVLLSELCDTSTDSQGDQGLFEFGNYLLSSLQKELSGHMLPKVLGIDHDTSEDALADINSSGKDNGWKLFMENLIQHAHVLWKKALDCYTKSECSCCNVLLTKKELPEFTGKGTDVTCINESDESFRPTLSELSCQRGCLVRDPLVQLCQLLFLCCSEHIIAELLASVTWLEPCSSGLYSAESVKRMVLVKSMMQMVVSQGRGSLVLELLIQRIMEDLTIASDEQALQKIIALRELIDVNFWQNQLLPLESVGSFPPTNPLLATTDEAGPEGLSRKLIWKLLHTEVDAKWLHLLSLIHREGAWDLRLAILDLLKLLPPCSRSRTQAIVSRLKGVLGIYFCWLESCYGTGDLKICQQQRNPREVQSTYGVPTSESKWRLQNIRAIEKLKRIIIELASCSYQSFTLMINSLLDFSFEHSPQIAMAALPCSSKTMLSRSELLTASMRRMGSTSRMSFSVAPLSTGRLNRYGKLTLVPEWASEAPRFPGMKEINDLQLTEENCRIQSGGIRSWNTHEREKFVGFAQTKRTNLRGAHDSVQSKDDTGKTLIKNREVLELELGSLLCQTLKKAIARSAEVPDAWPSNAVSMLGTLMIDRLETPHEVPMTMEQYEEVLPKHISSLRHIFLTECFRQNPLLMEMLELVIKYGENRELLRCVEFVRVLLADSISHWHSAFRTRGPHFIPPAKVDEEAQSRKQVNRLIQLVASGGWLPHPLAASGEIVSVIDGADIADLLLLVWRCMHYAIAFSSRAWGGSSSNFHVTKVSTDGQGTSTGSGGDEEASKDGTYTEWEGHYFAILRHNISQIGPHFAQVCPTRKT